MIHITNTHIAILDALARRSYSTPHLRVVVRDRETEPFLFALTALEMHGLVQHRECKYEITAAGRAWLELERGK